MFEVFEELESEVRSYCRKYPAKFSYAKNAEIFTVEGERYVDFLAVAGSMNYGHNNPVIKKEILDYLSEDRIINALDMYTDAKEDFFDTFSRLILQPRGYNYKIMCCGSTGTNAVEAALKLARKNTGRTGVFAFSGAFHGMTLGSLALTTDAVSRKGSGVPLNNVTFIPFEGTLDSIEYLKWLLEDDHSGVDKPAAIIVETVQAEGGVNVASEKWLVELQAICAENDIILICDDIQVGNGRTGTFFSFERANIQPDMVVLSKSISGFGLPMSLLLMKPELDIFAPAEHNGTFRGNQLSFVGGAAALKFFVENKLDVEVKRKAIEIEEYIKKNIINLDNRLVCRGIGMIWGIDFSHIDSALAARVAHKCFEEGLIIEIAGRKDAVLKIMPPLTISDDVLYEGLDIIRKAITDVINM